MFWNRKQEEQMKQAEYDLLTDAIERLEKGDMTSLPSVYCAFALKDPCLVNRSGRAIWTLLKDNTTQMMIRLSERFRQYTSLEWRIDWKDIRMEEIKAWFETEEDYKYALIIGSFHPNGYFREQCIREMAEYPKTLPYLILRMNDWVGNIRTAAVEIAANKLDTCSLEEIFQALPALMKVKQSERRENQDLLFIEEQINREIEKKIKDTPVYLILNYEFHVRKSIYRILFSRQMIEIEKADFLLAREKHSFCQTIIISGILKNYGCSPEQIDRYLQHKSAYVRRKALEQKYEIIKDVWAGLPEFLLDKNRWIREFTVFILERHSDFDISGFYAAHLTDEKPETAITGIGETGQKDHVELIRPFLTHPSESVVRAAIEALGKMLKYKGEDLYWSYLFDKRASVSKAAFQAIRNSGIHYGADQLYESWVNCEAAHVKQYLIRLFVQGNSWSSLPYLILLYQDQETIGFQARILAALRCRSLYAGITKEQGELIRKILDEFGDSLPGKLADEIRFDLKFVVKG